MPSFSEVFGYPSEVMATAPGRVNLLGEHTDYNDGYVLPTAIPQLTRVEIAPSKNDRFTFYSTNLEEMIEYGLNEAPPSGFGLYIYGCIEVLRTRGYNIAPIAVHVSSDIPIGSGLSSSAGLEVAVLRGLRKLYALNFDDVELAQLAQQAEVEFAGVRCGILDQMASSLGDTEHMLFLDTRTLERRLLPLPPNAELIVIDSGVSRELSKSGYNERRAECELAAKQLGVKALRDVTDPVRANTLPPPLNKRAKHVITENLRVLAAARGVSAQEFGELMNKSHTSLRDDYEVSIDALDVLVTLLQQQSSVYGARLTGAGFGGACVALAHPAAVTKIKNEVLTAYTAAGHSGKVLV